jgi:phage tail protein X
MWDRVSWPQRAPSPALADVPSRTVVRSDAGDLEAVVNPGQVFRVGFEPEPWGWTPWEYATEGRFHGRFDDPHGSWRATYAASTRVAAFLEVLARVRPNPLLVDALGDIKDDVAQECVTAAPGTVTADWLARRCLASAHLHGCFVAVTHAGSLATLRAQLLPHALSLGLGDVDAGVLKEARPRALTQLLASWLAGQMGFDGRLVDGIAYTSRHGDGLALWAVFESPDSHSPVSELLTDTSSIPIGTNDVDLVEAFRLHRLAWG